MTKKYHNKKKPYFIWFFLVFILFEGKATYAVATAQDVHDIVDICVNLHRIQKDYALIGMGVKYDDPKKDLEETILKVDQEFSRLIDDHHLAKNEEEQVVLIQERWKKIKALVQEPPSQEGLVKLHKDIENLTDLCLKTAKLLEESTGIEGEEYVVLSSELGMEVQRLAALYMMRAWDVEYEDYFDEVRHVLDEFEGFYQDLNKADERFVSAKVKGDLTVIEKEFLVFEQMTESTSGRFVPSLAQRKANSLLTKINVATESIIKSVEK